MIHEKKKNKLNIKKGKLKSIMGKEIDLTIKSSTKKKYYYYKRWLWMMFPWACLSSSDDYKYSDFMKICYSDNDKGIRFKEEVKLVEDSLAIIQVSKIKKKDILYSEARSKRIFGSSQKLGSRTNFMNLTKKSSSLSKNRDSRQKRSASVMRRRQFKHFRQNSMNLSAIQVRGDKFNKTKSKKNNNFFNLVSFFTCP